MLRQLPRSLESLSVINCPTFDIETLSAFFKKHGRTLKHLALKHNQSLDLTFLPGFAISCPELQSFQVDLTYFSASVLASMDHRSDAEPRYQTLLHSDDYPTWPPKLEQLHLLHLRKLNSETATTLFESLVEAAPSLKQLRTLVIKAILDVSWRERAGFREKWISDLKAAFLRDAPAPDRVLSSKRMFRLAKARQQEHANSNFDSFSSTAPVGGGYCGIVDISIDNMRPTELRFTEDDFMDSESSGDEDWNGETSEVEVDRTYAW